MRRTRLPGVRTDEPVIGHVDMDCFYAACERLREPPLRDEPIVVGMGYDSEETHGAVATASYEAREFGVESAESISTALEKLPRKVEAASDPELDVSKAGFYRPVDMEFYESVADDVRTILHDSAEVVREVSIDEAYLDISNRIDWVGNPRQFARRLKDRIEEEVGVTASVGIAPTMSAAKVASDHDKPDGLVVVKPGEVRDFLGPLSVEEVHGVGPVTARELQEMGIETAGDLAEAEPGPVEQRFGERGLEVYRHARGEDDRSVEPRGDPKSLSRESAFTEATGNAETKRERTRQLAAAVAGRATRRDALYRTIGIKVVTPPFDVHTRARTLSGPVDDPELVETVALELLNEFAAQSVRKLGVRLSNLSFAAGKQANLDGEWDSTVDGQSGTESTDSREPDGKVHGIRSSGIQTPDIRCGQLTLDDFR